MDMTVLVFLLAAYLIGSISFAVLVSRWMQLPDPRTYGSHNPGATNVLRTGKRKAALLTLLGDGVKGWLAVVLTATLGARYGLGKNQMALAGLAVLLGHMWPLFFRFRGGKGVATALGVLFAFNAWLALAAGLTWGAMLAMFRVSAGAAIITALLVPVYAYFIEGPSSVYFGSCVIIAILVIHRHKSNLLHWLTK